MSSHVPLVSVILSVYNGAPYLPQCLAGLAAQTWADWELIAIDDGSSDATPTILAQAAAKDPRIRVLTNPANLGLTRSLNKGLAEARGRYIARQDVDDLSLPNRLAAQVAFMEAHPEVVLLGSSAQRMDAAGRPLATLGRHPASDRAIRLKMLLHNAFFHSSVMLRRSVLSEHGLTYDEALPYAQDYDLWSRLMTFGQAANLPEPLIRFRAHAGQLSSTRAGRQQAVATRVARANLERAGLGLYLTPTESHLARLSWLAPEDLAPAKRIHQLRVLRRLFRLAMPKDAGPECRRVAREQLLNCRKYLVRPPRSRAMLRAQLTMWSLGPWGALRDVLTWLWRRLDRRFVED